MKKILILCNGQPPAERLFRKNRAQADRFIAADGGGNIARDFKAEPDVVIGDLDSYQRSGNESFEIVFQADQETNDLEKALNYAQKKGGTHICVLGATGLRLDQTLKNLSVLKQFDNYFESIVFRDDFGETRLIESPFEEHFPVGTTVSLFPLSGAVSGVRTKGLKFPLQNEKLENGVRDGSSNKVIENTVTITYKTGDLLLFVAD